MVLTNIFSYICFVGSAVLFFKLYFVHKQKWFKQHKYKKENAVKEDLGLGFFVGGLVVIFKTARNLSEVEFPGQMRQLPYLMAFKNLLQTVEC